MNDEFLLLNPGPVPVSKAVREAMTEPMISHRSQEFQTVYQRAQSGLDYIFTRSSRSGAPTAENGLPLILNGTATMGMEAAIANLVDRDSEVVTFINGKFGRRFARIADRYCSVTPVEIEWGQSFDPDRVADVITDETDVVTMVHNETSTGVLNPLEAVGAIARDRDAYFVVDGVTSIGGDEFDIDAWNVDVVITDAQKALAIPPGISALYVTDRAIAAFDGERAPFYEDLDWHVEKAREYQTPFTSAIPLFRALAVAVEQIEAEGMDVRIARHHRQSAAFRSAFEAMGLTLFPNPSDPSSFSNTVTAVSLPEPIRGDASAFFDAVNQQGVSISGGQAHLSGEIFRVSNMGQLRDEQILRGIKAIGTALTSVGADASVDEGVAIARDRLEATVES